MNLHFRGTRVYKPLGHLIAQLAPGAVSRDRTGTYRITTWRADRYTMTAVPDEGVEPALSLCRSDALPLRQPGLNSLGIPGRIRTCDSRFVVWNDLRFTTGTRFTGAMTTGVEPVTFAVTRQDSDQLSYATMFLRSGTWIRTRRDGLTVRSFTC